MGCIPESAFLPLIAWDLPSRALGAYGEHIDGCSRCAGQVRAAMERAPELGIDPAPPVRFDDFELLRPLGRGTTGRLYLGRDRQLGRLVALKFLITDRMGEATCARLLTEARALARLQHPNVVAVFRVGEVAGRRYLAYEYVPGRSLERAGPLAFPELLRLGLGVARGLAAAHQRGVLHRDIKPGNVLYSGDGEAKLVDFGLAKLSEEDDGGAGPVLLSDSEEMASTLPVDASSSATTGLTRPGQLIGTPLYMAPEAWQGAPAAAACDLYGVGLVLYELAAGDLPHARLPMVQLCRHVLGGALPPLATRCPQLPVGFTALVDRCLQREPADRPDAAALVAGLEALTRLVGYGARRSASEPLHADDAARVAASLARLREPGALVPAFYARLFAEHPYLRPLFPYDMDGQHAKLASALHLVVANLEQPAALGPTLADLGRRHRGYGATRGHYAAVRTALLGALAEALGDDHDEAAWGRALDRMISAMQGEDPG